MENRQFEALGYDNAALQVDGPEDHPIHPLQQATIELVNEKTISCQSSSFSSNGDDADEEDEEEEEEDTPVDDLTAKGWLTSEPRSLDHEMSGVALPSIEPPSFGEVKVENSTNVHLGNRTFYKGPVTIKQVVYANSTSHIENKGGDVSTEQKENGSASPTYAKSNVTIGRELLRKYRWAIGVATTAVIIVLIALVCLLMSGTGDSTEPILPATPNDSSVNNAEKTFEQAADPTIPGVRIVSRIEWVAQPPKEEPTPLQVTPVPYVIISHTATAFCYTQAQCVLNLRYIQTFHIESKGWNDIAYNFLVGGDGLVYTGRGWDIEGAHTFNYNIKSIGLSFIGTFNSEEPTNAQLHAAKKLIELGVKIGKIRSDYKLLGHRQCIKTESPGEVLYNIIKTWDHWSPTP